MNILLDLFMTFAKVGLFTFGGGYAMISLIHETCVEKKKWLTDDEMMNVTVIAESTPGPIAINAATFCGNKIAGIKGSIAATVGMVMPSFLIILAISFFLDNFLEIAWVAHAFKGIKIAVGILILNAALTLLKKMKKKPFPISVMLISFAVIMAVNFFSIKLSSIIIMLAAALASLLIGNIKSPSTDKKGGEAK